MLGGGGGGKSSLPSSGRVGGWSWKSNGGGKVRNLNMTRRRAKKRDEPARTLMAKGREEGVIIIFSAGF